MSTDPVLFDGLLASSTRNPSARTYSHKVGSKTRAKFLPQLKPSPVHRAAKRKLVDDSPEPELNGETSLGNWPPSATGKDQSAKIDDTYPYEDEYGDDTVDHDERIHDLERYSSSLLLNLQRTPLARDTPNEDDRDEDEDDEDNVVQYRRSPRTSITDFQNRRTRQTPSTPVVTSSVRRKPFLMFNKIPSKSTRYKKLERRKPDSSQGTAENYIPGDGFSDSEARPNGLFHKRRKLHFSAPAVGILDLTQTPPRPLKPTTPTAPSQPKEPRIILKRKKRAKDNSFLPSTPKKPRQKRPRENEEGKTAEKDQSEETQRAPGSGFSATYGQVLKSVILGEFRNNEEQLPGLPETAEKNPADKRMKEGAPGNDSAEIPSPVLDDDLPAVDNQGDDNDAGHGHEKDELSVPSSEDDYVPATQYPRSKSLPPVEAAQRDELVLSARSFRRVKTN